MFALPDGLLDGQKLPRRRQVSGGGAWYLAGPGSFERVGGGDLSYANLLAIEAELAGRVFVALPLLRSLQEHVAPSGRWAARAQWRGGPKGPMRRLHRYEQLRDSTPPTVSAVARGAQVAILAELGPVWVDAHRLFQPGDTVPLPWTEPRVELTVLRASALRSAMREVIGPRGPRRASEAAAG